jgi:hypothetical protein
MFVHSSVRARRAQAVPFLGRELLKRDTGLSGFKINTRSSVPPHCLERMRAQKEKGEYNQA